MDSGVATCPAVSLPSVVCRRQIIWLLSRLWWCMEKLSWQKASYCSFEGAVHFQPFSSSTNKAVVRGCFAQCSPLGFRMGLWGYRWGNQCEGQGGPVKARDLCRVKCRRIRGSLTKTVMFDPKAQVKC